MIEESMYKALRLNARLYISVRRSIKRAYLWIRFGKITRRVTATAGHGVDAEIEYVGRFGKVVGYWAYGYWEPGSPYKGDV